MTMSITEGHIRIIPCSHLSDCKNVQKSALKSVNVQRTEKSILQMFAFSFFDGSHICRFLPILRPPTVPRSHFSYPKTKAFTLIISHLYLQIVTSASESRFCVEKKSYPYFRKERSLNLKAVLLFAISCTTLGVRERSFQRKAEL